MLKKPFKSIVVRKCAVIWKVCSGKKFPVISFRQFSGNFRKNRNKFPEIFRRKFPEISGLTTLHLAQSVEFGWSKTDRLQIKFAQHCFPASHYSPTEAVHWSLHLTARGVDGCRVGAGKEKKQTREDERMRELNTCHRSASCETVQVCYRPRDTYWFLPHCSGLGRCGTSNNAKQRWCGDVC